MYEDFKFQIGDFFTYGSWVITLLSLSPWQCRTGEWMLELNLARAGLILEAAGYQPKNIIYTVYATFMKWVDLNNS